jgi:exonuclease SbcD
MGVIDLLVLADTHLGFDAPVRPRVQRRRRGVDFFENTLKALKPAFEGRVDAVVHCGDLLFRSRVSAELVDRAFAGFKQVADRGVPVYIVPGNHECSRIPRGLLGLHPGIHVFDRPRTFYLERRNFRLALSGFPYWRDHIRSRFPEILERTGWQDSAGRCQGRVLCVHHCFEGATVGPAGYMFRWGTDVIKHQDMPSEFCAVLSGHIHRHQVLTRDLQGRRLAVPVLYPGSVDRTSFAEMDEDKGYLLVRLKNSCCGEKPGLAWRLQKLPTRPMVRIHLPAEQLNAQSLRVFLHRRLSRLDPSSIVRLQVSGTPPDDGLAVLRADSLRRISPPQMNISLRFSQHEPSQIR